MADEKGLVVRAAPVKEVDTRPRTHGMLTHRYEALRNAIDRQLAADVKDQALVRFAFLDDEDLARATIHGRPLTARQKRIARAFEMSKKDAPVALQYGHERLVNAQRAQQEQKSISINVERAVIRVPDTKHDDVQDAVIIEGDLATR